MSRPTLIICIDRDNDLYEKAKVAGPLIGREKNLQGAIALVLADPEDPDSNAIFYAIKTYDKLKAEGGEVELVTLTGDRALGFKADRSISSQLEKIIEEFSPSSSILISDGPSDEEILPIIKSRLRVDSTRIVFIKQAKELEQTYFVLLEKIKDPYFARIFIGIPAILLLLLSVSSYLGWGWQPVGVLIGLYLLIRISGLEDYIISVFHDFRFSFERTSWVGYLGSFAIFTIGLYVAYQTVRQSLSLGLSEEKLIFSVVGNTVWIFFVGLLLVLIGKIADSLIDKRRFDVSKYLLYLSVAILSSLVLYVGSLWIVNLSEPYVDFQTFLITLAASLTLGYISTRAINWYRKEIIQGLKLEGKEAIYEHGSYVGKIIGFDPKKGSLMIQTIFDKKLAIPLSLVQSIDEKVIIKSSE